MARKDALLRLHSRLLSQRASLLEKIAGDLDLTHSQDDGINDLAETASLMEQSELHSQLAALESRELGQIDAAIAKIRGGTYGRCDRCEKAIPVARLQALPYTSVCVECQRKRESRQHLDEDDSAANWASALEYERRSNDRELSIQDLDVN